MNNRNARVVAFISGKGGVGKTTLISNLGALLALKRKHILFIDLDYQSNLSSCVNTVPKQQMNNACVSRAYEHDTKDMTKPFSNDFRPARINDYVDIFTSDKSIDTHAAVMHNNNPSFAPYVILHMFNAFNLNKKYDYILIDCHNSFSLLAKGALVVADKVVTPVTPSRFGISAVDTIIQKLKIIKTKIVDPSTQKSFINVGVPLFVGNMIDFTTSESHAFEKLIKNDPYFVAGFHRRVLFSRATTHYCSIFKLAREDKEERHQYNNQKAIDNEIVPEFNKLIKAINK